VKELHDAARLGVPLEQQLAELKAVYAAMHDGLVVFDAQGQAVVVNEAAARLLGFESADELLRSLRFFAELFELTELDGTPLALEAWPVSCGLRGERVAGVELCMRRKDTGQEWVMRFSAEPVFDEQAALRLVVLISSDMTERVRRERALRASEERFRALADSMPQLVWTAAADGVVDYYNARAREYAGIEQVADGSWRWHPIVHPDDLQATIDAWSAAVAGGVSYQCEHRVRMQDGTYRWHVSRAHRVGAGAGERWFGTATDIHEQKLAEENLRRAMATRDQVVSVVAHDLRNPLNVVRLSLPVLRRVISGEGVWKQAEPHIERVERQVLKIEGLIDEFLDAATLQAGQPLALARRRCDLVALVRELVEHSRQAGASGVELVSDVDSLFGDWDPDRLERVISNLLSNAVKYSAPASPVAVELEARAASAVVRVRDQGMGIGEADQKRIFDWFVRGENAQRLTLGIGIGLAGARRIVEQHGGTLSVQSTLGAGATFTIELPLAAPPGVSGRG
jgi:PAS domain S-box-containing protein